MAADDLSRVGLGSARLGSGRLRLTVARVCELLEAACEAGINYVDTADSYGCGRAEELIGEALAETRLPFTIMTKAGFTYVRMPKPFAALNNRAQWLLHRLRYRDNYEPGRIAQCLDLSLRRLRRERVGVFFLHQPSLRDIDSDRLLTVLREMTRSGKAAAVGISSDDPEVIHRGLGLRFFQVLQTSVHPAIPDEVRTLIAAWASEGGRVIGHSLAFGRADAADSMSLDEQQRNASSGLSAMPLIIRRALRTPGVSSVLTGTVDPHHLRANALAAAMPELVGTHD
jgi:aryl-alcohol dehydrogenase-like predicted oxidoreductase